MRMMEERWTDAFLDEMRGVCDPPADRAARGVNEQEQLELIHKAMDELVTNEQVVPESLPESLRDFFMSSQGLPDWAQPVLIRKGQQLFNSWGLQMLLSLFCAALPSCYAAHKGVKVLYRTGTMAKSPTDLKRRILETAQMVMDVMAPALGNEPGGLESGGRGIRTAQKVRLMHAVVRGFVRTDGTWMSEWGEPINQEDMAGTLLSFSTVTLRCLPKLGYTPGDDEVQAYYHAWRVVGFIMGVDERLLPERHEDGALLYDAIVRRQFRYSVEGEAMTRVLLELLEHVTPGDVFDGVWEVLMHHLMGPTAELIRVERKDKDWWDRLALGPLKLLSWVGDTVDEKTLFTQKMSEFFGRRLMEGVVWAGRGRNRLPFRIPESLRRGWGVPDWERPPPSLALS